MRFATASYPKTTISFSSLLFIRGVAGLIILMAVAQLMTLENFIPILQSYGSSLSLSESHIFAALVITTEVFALPFLLRMNLSFLMRRLSASCLVLAGFIWGGLGVWATVSQPLIFSYAVFGVIFMALVLASFWSLRDDTLRER